MFRDFLYAYRQLKKSPVATGVLMLALALGIGANASMFSSINSIILHPFPYPNLDRIMTVWETIPRLRLEQAGVAPANFADFKTQNRSFDELAAYRPWNVNIIRADRPDPVSAVRVTAGFFQIFGMTPKIGRTFADENERVAVLSEGFWRSRFAAAPDITGKTISLGGENYTIVGVMPDDFDYPLAAEVWVPLTLSPTEKAERVVHNSLVVGLLKKGVSAEQAQADMQAIAQSLARQYPKTNDGWSAAVSCVKCRKV